MKIELHIIHGFAVLLWIAMAGCEANHYAIEMRPTGETVERELICWRERTTNEKTEVVAFSEDELKRIAAAYEKAPAETAKKHRFTGIFTGQMPNDVGGSGSYTHWRTALGSVSAYVERFRGDDDLAASIETRQEAVDQITDLLVGWLSAELAGEPGFEQLRDFLQNRLRRDLKNLSLYAWASNVVNDREDGHAPEFIMRVAQYLMERSYFTPDQLPALRRAVYDIERDDPARLLAIIQRFIAMRMGAAPDQPIPPSLQFLADRAACEISVNDYLRRTADYQRILANWERERTTNPDLQKPAPIAVFGDLIAKAFVPDLHFGRADQLNVKLAATNKPFMTNGEWDDDAKQVQWLHDMQAADAEYFEFPTFLFAVWSQPDEQAQQAHFGKVVLQRSALGDYCLWHRGLSAREAEQWNKFIAGLRPGAGLVKQIRTFRFSHETASDEGKDLAAVPRELILSGLSAEATPD